MPCATAVGHFYAPGMPTYTLASLLYLPLYSRGDIPVIFLNTSRKAFTSAYPTAYMTSLIVFLLDSKAFFADSIFTRCEYSTGVFPVALINLLSKFRLPTANSVDKCATDSFSCRLLSI